MASSVEDIVPGMVIAGVTVVRRLTNPPLWECLCVCGAVLKKRTYVLRTRDQVRCRSCSMQGNDHAHRTVGTRLKRHPHYHRWSAMVRRCTKPASHKWEDYGGRGIMVYEPWLDFQVYARYIEENLGPKPGDGYSIDRIDNDGNYEPGNLRWATAKEQAANRRPRYGVV